MSPAEVNGKAIVSRKERARQLTEEIRAEIQQTYESFYHVGMKLRQVEWQYLGYDTLKEYLSEEFQMGVAHYHRLINAAKLRPKLPDSPKGDNPWTETHMREFLRLEEPKEQVKVARKVVAFVEKHPERKITASLVRQFVEEEKTPKPPKEKPVKEGEGNLHVILMRWVYQMEEWRDELKKNVPREGWILLREKQPEAVKRFIAACDSLAMFAKEGSPDAKRS